MDKTPASGVLKPLYQQIETERLKIEATLAKQWKGNLQIQLLQTIPGVGPIVSYTIVAAVGDIQRFASADKRAEAEGLKTLFYKIMFKRGSQVAIVAVARKLLTIAYHVLKEEKAFDGTRVGSQKTHHKQRSRSNSTMADAVDLAIVACGT